MLFQRGVNEEKNMQTRLEKLLELYHIDHTDPFVIYALALEYRKLDIAKSAMYFELLLEQHESYLPTYYHAAELFAERGDKAKAVATYEKGIIVARMKQDHHALRELENAYRNYLFDE